MPSSPRPEIRPFALATLCHYLPPYIFRVHCFRFLVQFLSMFVQSQRVPSSGSCFHSPNGEASYNTYSTKMNGNRVTGNRGGTVVKVMCYKSEGCWFDSRWCHWNFFPIALWPWIPGAFPGGKGGRFLRLTNLPPSCAVVMKSGTLWATPGL